VQFVDVLGKKSKRQKTLLGVPAGSILGPIMFSLFVNDLSKSVSIDRSIMFADDGNLLFLGHPKDLQSLKLRIEQCMRELFEYLFKKKLSQNVEKTKMLILAHRSFIEQFLILNLW